MNLKVINILYLLIIVLSPIVIYSISSFSQHSSEKVAFYENTEEENGSNEDKDGEEEDRAEYLFLKECAPHLDSPSWFKYLNKSERLILRSLEILLPPPKKL